jgi:hypothetical protein
VSGEWSEEWRCCEHTVNDFFVISLLQPFVRKFMQELKKRETSELPPGHEGDVLKILYFNISKSDFKRTISYRKAEYWMNTIRSKVC